MSALIHGRYTTYSNRRCRCSACRQAWAEYMRGWKARQTVVPSFAEHGRVATYHNYRCRCQDCRGAWAAYNRELHAARRAAS